MKRYLFSLAAMLTMCLQAQPAAAATFVESYRFSVESDGPIATFDGTTTVVVDEDDAASRVVAFGLTVGAQPFTAANVALRTLAGGRLLVFGSIPGPAIGVDAFNLIFDRENLPGAIFGYTLTGTSDGFGYTRVTVVRLANAVPEPATWALMIVGFAVTGAALRRRRRPSHLSVVSG